MNQISSEYRFRGYRLTQRVVARTVTQPNEGQS